VRNLGAHRREKRVAAGDNRVERIGDRTERDNRGVGDLRVVPRENINAGSLERRTGGGKYLDAGRRQNTRVKQ